MVHILDLHNDRFWPGFGLLPGYLKMLWMDFLIKFSAMTAVETRSRLQAKLLEKFRQQCQLWVALLLSYVCHKMRAPLILGRRYLQSAILSVQTIKLPQK